MSRSVTADGSRTTRLRTATRLRVAELVRQPLTLVSLVLLPPVVVELYGIALSSFPQLPTMTGDPATMGRTTGALFSVAFLAGLVGLFQAISAREGDERVAIAGFPRWALLATRLLTVGLIALAVSSVAFLVYGVQVSVASPVVAFAVLILAAVLYGLIGVLVGTLVPRELEGSLVLVFLADIDNALSSGLFPVQSVEIPVVGSVAVTDFVPLYHPHELFTAAALDGELATDHVAPALAWIGILLLASFLAYSRSTGDDWTGLASRAVSLGRWST